MSKSLHGRCIQRWKFEFKDVCDSKVSAHWRKRDLKGFIRESAIIMADSMIDRMAEENAMVDFSDGLEFYWSPEFAEWYYQNREQYMKEAREYLNLEADTSEIDDNIQEYISIWNQLEWPI